MPSASLIVPTVLTSGSLHFAQVAQAAVAQDVINALLASNEVRTEILGDLDDQGWALQGIRAEHSGRSWEEDELEALGDGKNALELLDVLTLGRRDRWRWYPSGPACECLTDQADPSATLFDFPLDFSPPQPRSAARVPSPALVSVSVLYTRSGDSR